MMHCGGAMSVRGLFVKFSGALMRIVWHDDPSFGKADGYARFTTGLRDMV
jgi:hypothetical protein